MQIKQRFVLGAPVPLVTPTGVDIAADNISATNVTTTNLAATNMIISGSTTTTGAFLNVKDFGAVGNGVADDTASIQSALNAANTAGGGEVFAPAGTYKITAALNMPPTPINFVGAGRNATILFSPAAGHDGVQPTGAYSRIAHMTIRGPNTSGAGIGIDSGSTNYVTLEDLVVESWGGHNINSGGGSSYWTLINIISRSSVGGEGVLITAQSNFWRISNFIAYGNRFNGIDMSGIGHTLNNVTLYQNGGNGASGVDQDGLLIVTDASTSVTRDITVTNLYCFQNNTHGVRIQTLPNTVIQRIALTNVVCWQNGQGDLSNNPNTRVGDGITILNSSSTTANSEAIEDISLVNVKMDSNYRWGVGIVSNTGNPNPVQRISIGEIQALNHTGWTGTLGAAGILLFGANLFSVKIIGQSVSNTTNLYDGINFIDTDVRVLTNDVLRTTWSTGLGIPGANIISNGNTEILWQSTASGAHSYAWFVDNGGNFGASDTTSGGTRLLIRSTGVVDHPAGLSMANGTVITHFFAASATLAFPSTPAQSSSDLTATFAGALNSFPVAVAPAPNVWAGSGAGFYTANCQTNGVVTIRFVNPTAAAIAPPSGGFIFHQFQY